MAEVETAGSGSVRVPARVRVFGHEPGRAEVALIARSTRWRGLNAARPALIGLVVAPLAALVPPHVPWAAGAALTGLVLARRRWTERHTLTALDGACPRCGETLRLDGHTRLRRPHPLDCGGCRHRVSLSVAEAELP